MLLTQLLHLGKEISDLKELVNDLVLSRESSISHSPHDYTQSHTVVDLSSSNNSDSIKISSPTKLSSQDYHSDDEPELANEYIDELPLTLEEQFKQRIR
jgi:hypothetical protein